MLSEEFIDEYINNNKSGKMSSIKYVCKNYIDDFNKIIEFCEINCLENLPFKEKVYHTTNNISNDVLCKNPSCDNIVKFKNSKIGYHTYCSNKCVGSDPDIIKMKELKSLSKFGTKTPSESREIKDKIISTNIERYGHNSPMCSVEIRNKSIQTLKSNYGVSNPAHSKEIQNKRVESFKKNIDSWKKSYEKTSLLKYGVKHPWCDEHIHSKSVSKSAAKKRQNTIKLIKSKLDDNYNFIDVEINVGEFPIVKIHCDFCDEIFDINREMLYWRNKNKTKICTNCNPISKSVSGLGKQLLSFIQDNYNGVVISNTRSVINPYELDIYLPDLNLGFEFNGLYWHSELNKHKDYHLDKTNKCSDNNIQLIHIWEDDWMFKSNIVKSMILNKITVKKVYYARKCRIEVNIGNAVVRKFLENNHLQGFVGGKIKIGLFYDDELVSLMTFGSLRKIMGLSKSEGTYELLRFCNKLNTNVIGGASKMLKFFTDTYKPDVIISYSDNSYSNGNLYSVLGFEYVSDSAVNYSWVVDNVRRHRYNYRKSELVKKGYDNNKTEVKIMYDDVGAYRVWNCGQKKWIYKL